MSGQDEPISYREKAIIEATADAVMQKLTETYRPEEYGKEAFKQTLDDYFAGITAETHLRHHNWVADASTGRTTQEISWKDFWYSLAKGSAAMVLGFIALAVLWAIISYIKAGAPPLAGVSH